MRSRLIPILAAASLALGLSTSAQAADKVTLPSSWLFCSGAHEIEVLGEESTDRP